MKTKKKLINILLWANGEKDNQLEVNKDYIDNLEQFNKDKEERIARLHNAKCKAENEVTSLEAQNKSLQGEKEKLESEVTRHKSNSLERFNENNELVTKYAELVRKNSQLQSELSKVQSEKEQIKEQLGLADFTVAKLKSALSKFEDFKKEADKVTEGVTVWIARGADNIDGYYMFSKKPILRSDGIFVCPANEGLSGPEKMDNVVMSCESNMQSLVLLKKGQCKQFLLSEVKP